MVTQTVALPELSGGWTRGTLPRVRSAALSQLFATSPDGRNQQKRDKMQALMVPVKAHVRNGYFVSDEPANLPEGTSVELQLVTTDPWADMDPAERAELEESIEEGFRDVERGDVEDALAYAERLLANTK